MKPFLTVVIVVAWILLVVGAALCLALYGRPWRHSDPVISWHVVGLTLVAGLEPIALAVARWSLAPSAVIYLASVGIMYWRVVMLIHGRHRLSKSVTPSDESDANG